jgi:hypothetical protein
MATISRYLWARETTGNSRESLLPFLAEAPGFAASAGVPRRMPLPAYRWHLHNACSFPRACPMSSGLRSAARFAEELSCVPPATGGWVDAACCGTVSVDPAGQACPPFALAYNEVIPADFCTAL